MPLSFRHARCRERKEDFRYRCLMPPVTAASLLLLMPKRVLRYFFVSRRAADFRYAAALLRQRAYAHTHERAQKSVRRQRHVLLGLRY